MTMVDAVAVTLQLVLPGAFLAWVAMRRRAHPLALALDALTAALYLGAIALAGLWLPLPRATVAVMLAGFGVVWARDVVRLRRGARPGLPARPRAVALATRSAAVLTSAGLLVVSAGGRAEFFEAPLALELPLGGGAYQVAAGGSAPWRNPHLKTLAEPRFRDYRGQSYAVDLVARGPWGSRSWPPFADGLDRYAVFGATVVAPCSGTVVQSADGRPDLEVTGGGARALLGNHVVIDCGGTWVVLAHLREGSVGVGTGDTLAVGDRIGEVGNSGRSDEPHLHIHAQTPGTTDAPLSGEPVPILIQGRHLVRNDRVRAAPGAVVRGP